MMGRDLQSNLAQGERDVLQGDTASSKQSSRANMVSHQGEKTAKAAGAITPLTLTVPQGSQPDLASESITTVLLFTPLIWQHSTQTSAGGNAF